MIRRPPRSTPTSPRSAFCRSTRTPIPERTRARRLGWAIAAGAGDRELAFEKGEHRGSFRGELLGEERCPREAGEGVQLEEDGAARLGDDVRARIALASQRTVGRQRHALRGRRDLGRDLRRRDLAGALAQVLALVIERPSLL